MALTKSRRRIAVSRALASKASRAKPTELATPQLQQEFAQRGMGRNAICGA
jgi:hypothetical protein